MSDEPRPPKPPKQPTRYDQLLKLIDEIRPSRIVEVGVARAVRAREMSAQALYHGGPVHYIGYDVFDTQDEAFHQAAYNHKSVESADWCRKKLGHIRRDWPLFTFDLVVGDTRHTLHGKNIVADFAFIDGDHRAEAIRFDYLALAGSKVVAFDDWYEMDERGIPDIDKLGCNGVIEELRNDPSVTVEILPHTDKGKFKGASRIAVVRRR